MFNLTLKRQKKIQKFFAVFTTLSLLLQSASGFLLARPLFAEGNSLRADLTFDSTKNSFTLTVNTLEEVDYLLVYKTPSKTEAVSGSGKADSRENFSREIYAGTCSSGGTCVPHEVLRGILKVQVKASHWLSAKKFIINDGELTIVGKETPTDIQLSDDENSWLEDPNQSPPMNPPEEGSQGSLSVLKPRNVSVSSFDLDSQTSQESASLNTDKEDYAPGEIVKITGENFPANTTLIIKVTRPDGSVVKGDGSFDEGSDEITTDEEGKFEYYYQLNGIEGEYLIEVLDASGAVLATTVFTDNPGNPSVNIDQCANGGVGNPPVQCVGGAWQNGNLNENKAHYLEGESVPYRATFNDLTLGETYTLAFEWDTTKSDKHAIDYLTSFNQTETNADACSDKLSDCSDVDTFLIPADVFMQSQPDWSGTQISGVFTIYNGTITGVSSYTLTGDYTGDSSTSIIVTFTADVSGTAILAWGGHIASRSDWGQDNAAVNISGSPYHMSLQSFSCSDYPQCSVGNQDLPLSASAVIFPGSITIIKEANPEGPQEFDFTGDLGDFALIDDGTSANTKAVADLVIFGDYAVTETIPSGWSLDSIVCIDPTQNSSTDLVTATADIDLSEGEDVTCTFTNSINKGTIIVEKQTNPDGDQTSFTFTGDAAGSIADGEQIVVSDLAPGAYTSTENVPSGWILNNISCDDTNSSGDLGTRTATFNLDPGETVKCTFINTLQQGHLTLIKTVTKDNGGTALATDWMLSTSGPTLISGVTGSASVTNAAVNSGNYTLSESGGPAGYTAGSWSCVKTGAAPVIGSSIDIAPGDNVTCTINNNDNVPSLTLDKIVVNDNGGTQPESAWTLTADGPTPLSGPGATGSTDVVSGSTFSAGTYTLSEAGPSGYTASSWICDEGVQSGNQITLGLNEDVTCTITNDDQPAHLIVIKHVDNTHGGAAVASDFTMTINGVTAQGGNSFPGEENPGTDKIVNTGTYNITESGPDGYESNFSTDCFGTIALGQTKTCTVTNGDKPATLTVIKHVINDNGGNAVAGDFTMNVTGTNVSSSSFAGSESGISVTLDAGSYSVDEDAFSGYTKSLGANCSGTIAIGQTKTCTITNDDVAPSITLVKKVINNNGGNAQPDDFALTVGGSPVLSGIANTFQANVAYAIDETQVSGYIFVSITGDPKCPGVLGGTVTLDEGDDITCTITNDDIAPTLTLEKTVVNDDGGSATKADFQAYINATAVPWGVAQTLSVGSHNASESGLPGYTASDWSADCAADGSVYLAAGDNKTCYITNDDIAPRLTLVKEVTNDDGGQAQPTDWDLYASGERGFGGKSPVSSTVKVGETYSLTEEDGPRGYTAGDWVCNGGTQSGNLITLSVADDVTCTITNDDIAPKLTLIKTVVNDNGGDKQVSDFNLYIDSVPATSGTAYEVIANVVHAASEDQLSGYAASVWGRDCAADGTITLLPGDEKTCTITNDDQFGRIIVDKITQPSGDNQSFNFTLIGGPSTLSQNFSLRDTDSPYDSGPILPGSGYSLSETVPTGWDLSGDVCVDGSPVNNINVSPGETVTCTFTNTKRGSIQGRKYQDVNGNGDFDQEEKDEQGDPNRLDGWRIYLYETDWTLVKEMDTGDDSTPAGNVGKGQYRFINVKPGTYYVCEELQTGWEQTEPSSDPMLDSTYCHVVELEAGEEVKGIQFGNIRYGSIAGHKWEDVDGNTNWDAGELGLDGWTIFLDENNNQALDAGEVSTTTTGGGDYSFPNLLPGDYDVCEVLQPGWTRTLPGPGCYLNLIVLPGEDLIDHDFGNQLQPIELSLEKSNDKSSMSPGDTATFTLTITNGGPGTAYDVVVTDVLPSGFSYVDNSGVIKGVSTNPSISGSVLSWSLGNIPASDSVVITYQAKAASDLESGTYTNLAFASGYNRSADAEEREKSETGIVDSTVKLVVVKSYSAAITGSVLGITTTRVGEVLGAATGAPTIYVVLALLMLILGIVFRYWQELKRFSLRKILRGIILVLAFLVFTAGIVQAGTLEVAIADLPDYLHTDTFKIYYTALGTEGNPITADFYYRKDGEATWKKIDGTVSGETGNVQLDNNYLPDEGRYYFKVEAASGGLTDSDETTTIIDRTAPGTPSEYGKERKSRTEFRLSWKNPSDSDFDKVLIYRSKERDFNADDGNKVGEVGGAPDSKVTWDNPGLENDVEYYYALRAVDKAGNASDLTGDGGSTTYEETIVEVTPTPGPAGAEEVVVLPEEKAEEGQILGEESEEETITEEVVPEAVSEEEKGLVKGVTEAARKFSWVWFVLGGAVIIAIGYWFLKKEEQEK